MPLNIKNQEAHRLARKLARATGKSITVAGGEAIRERLERIRGNSKKDLVERILEVSRDCAPRFKEPYKSVDHSDLLCDDAEVTSDSSEVVAGVRSEQIAYSTVTDLAKFLG
jgi:antitoxin VapB